jgi:hypothetical protein
LAIAFERETGRVAKVTWNNYRHRYEGRFITLVEGVLPMALTFAQTIKRPMPCPSSPRARGAFIFDLTRQSRRGVRATRSRAEYP